MAINWNLIYFERWEIHSQLLEFCTEDIKEIISCSNNEYIYQIRLNVSNTGLNDSYSEKKFEINTGKYIKLTNALMQKKIMYEDMLDMRNQYYNIEMEYVGSITLFKI